MTDIPKLSPLYSGPMADGVLKVMVAVHVRIDDTTALRGDRLLAGHQDTLDGDITPVVLEENAAIADAVAEAVKSAPFQNGIHVVEVNASYDGVNVSR